MRSAQPCPHLAPPITVDMLPSVCCLSHHRSNSERTLIQPSGFVLCVVFSDVVIKQAFLHVALPCVASAHSRERGQANGHGEQLAIVIFD